MTNENDAYLRLLDSLARFYNSEITAHVGYAATVTVSVLAALLAFSSLVIQLRYGLSNLLRNWVPWITSFWVVVLVVFVVAFFLTVFSLAPLQYLSLRYLFGRTQYYVALSQIVFEHMGLESRLMSREQDLFLKTLQAKAVGTPHGIEGGVISLFEARLFVSRCFRKKKESEGRNVEYLKAFGVLDTEIDVTVQYKDYFSAKILPVRGFSMCDLVFLGYKARIDRYTNASDPRGKLLKLEFDC
jgi:hypothetical protein